MPIYAITLQNEPHYEPADYPGMRLDPPVRAQVISQYLGPLFARSGIATLILDWDHNWDEPQSPLQVLSDSTAARYIAGVAWHCYAGDVSAQNVVHDAHPDKDAYFTECSGGEWAPTFADNLKWFVRTLIIGATRDWAKGVILWNLALDDQHGPHTGGCGNCRGVVTITSGGAVTRNVEYYALGHASRFVRPGARRVASTSFAAISKPWPSGTRTVAPRRSSWSIPPPRSGPSPCGGRGSPSVTCFLQVPWSRFSGVSTLSRRTPVPASRYVLRFRCTRRCAATMDDVRRVTARRALERLLVASPTRVIASV